MVTRAFQAEKAQQLWRHFEESLSDLKLHIADEIQVLVIVDDELEGRSQLEIQRILRSWINRVAEWRKARS